MNRITETPPIGTHESNNHGYHISPTLGPADREDQKLRGSLPTLSNLISHFKVIKCILKCES
jgi:hypothetical protein